MFGAPFGGAGTRGAVRRRIRTRAAFLAAVFAGLSTLGTERGLAQKPSDGTATDVGFAFPEAPARTVPGFLNRPEVLDLEPAVMQAELILAVRLVDVTETKIVHGGRDTQVTEQYQFEPIRVLKGIFARDSLLMTGQDLGIYRFAESADRLERGQLMLVLLGRQNQGFFNCNSGCSTLAQSIPHLEGKDDPLLATVEVLIGMNRQRDRAERVALLRDGLKVAKAREAAPLLLALGRRSLLGARDPGIAEAILPHLKAASPALREVAARTLASLLDTIPEQKGPDRRPEGRQGPGRLQMEAARALAASLVDAGPDLAARIAAIDALGSTGGPAIGRTPAALAWLDAEAPASTFAESAARLRVLGKLRAPGKTDEVARAYEALLLDAPAEIQEATGRALGRLDPAKAVQRISSRLARKGEAGLDIAPEIALLGELPADLAAPALLEAWDRPLDPRERLAFARACAVVADARLIPAAANLLDPQQGPTRAYAMEALRRVGTDAAAAALWPHLDEEGDPSRKLRLVAFLGRHGFRDGYARALEHLSQAALREEAVEAIAAIGEPKAIPELRRIWESSNDLAWNAAAIRALARLGQEDVTPKLLEIARAPGDPLAASALIGLGDLGSAQARPIVHEALASRRDEVVIAAARAAAKLLARPGPGGEGIRNRLAALLADVDASLPVRQAALESLVALDDPRLGPALAAVARDANLEGSPLLVEVERRISGREPRPDDPKEE